MLGQVWLGAGHGFELDLGLGVLLLAEQHARVGHLHIGCGLRLAGEIAGHQRFPFGHALFLQFHAKPGGAFAGGVQDLGSAGTGQRAGLVAGGQAHTPDGNVRGCRIGGLGQLVCQGLLDHLGGQGLVAGTGEHLGHDAQDGGFGLDGGLGQFLAQQFRGLADAVQGDQDLQHVAVGLARVLLGFAPGLGGYQCVVARARLQGHVGGPLVELGVVGAPRRFQHEGIACACLAGAGVDFAHEDFIEQLCVQRRVAAGGVIGRRLGRPWRHTAGLLGKARRGHCCESNCQDGRPKVV